tara:strand:- start:36 stop:1397 length:1362 start_codon:yes stop_codon:yes gene_type:complete
MASTYLTKTYSGNGNRNKGTISVWCKFSREQTSSDSTIFGAGNLGNDSDCTFLSVNGNGFGNVSTRQIIFALRIGGGTVYNAVSNNLLRDVNAWYHIVVRWDTTLGTPNCDIYLNGEEVSYSANNWSSVSQNTNTYIGSTAQPHYIGRGATNAMQNNYMDGCMSHLHYCDGYYYDASTFGSTDATTGEWKINTSPSVSYGTNGFWFFKDDNTLTDQSPNSNAFSLGGGTLTKTEDCPSSVFATVNPLVPSNIASLSNGNTTLRQSSASVAIATLGFQGGKYYWEVKNSNQQSYTQLVGILRQARMASSGNTGYDVGTNDGGWGYFMQSNADNGKSYHNGSLSSVYQTTSVNDILQVAVDGTAGKIWWGVNGTWVNSGDPANGTNAIYTNLPTDDVLFPAFSNYNAGQFQINFGNGYFGTTAVSSAGTNASNNGIFEYDVPTGFTALSTKGLNL